MFKKLAFTLAEVLITLGIIGLTLAMTLPTLINQTNQGKSKTTQTKVNEIMNKALGVCKSTDLDRQDTCINRIIDNYKRAEEVIK